MRRLALLALTVPCSALAEPPIKTLLLTGQNNHNWWFTSRLHADTLEATGRFEVDIADDAPAALADASTLGSYQLVVLDYNGPRWGENAERNFIEALSGGVGVVVIHAANNAFPGWVEYEKAVGLLWRDGAGHGAFHQFDVDFVARDHPVTRGIDALIAHPDELYHGLSNPQNIPFRVLATSVSSKQSGGTGKREPMLIALQYGKGRVFHTTLGHVWVDAEESKSSICDTQFKAMLARGCEWAATGEVTLPAAWVDTRQSNVLSDAQKADGWVLLFDGESPVGFRGYGQPEFPEKGWMVENGMIRKVAGAGGGDIISRDEYDDFELALEWKAAPGGNSGIMYRVTEDHTYPWETGPEMQILDDLRHNDGKNPMTSAGSMYAMYAPAFDVSRPAMQWNQVRIVVRGTHVEHWLNGWRVVEADLGGEEWKRAVAASKFNAMPDYGTRATGRITLQDHGDDVWFRNVMVRRLK